jgi:NADPH:quinone reductase
MKAIVRQDFGGPEQLQLTEVPEPVPRADEVRIRVRAFGINRAEQYFRQGLWGEVDPISGIECVGEGDHDPSGALLSGQRVMALMGGMGRTRPGSYAEYVCAPAANVVPVRSRLDWSELGALPESCATAWACLHDNLQLRRGDTLLLRGATSALGQAATALAAQLGANVIATTRVAERSALTRQLGARWSVLEGDGLPDALRDIAPAGVDAVLDLVGTRTLLESLKLARRGGSVCVAGFLGGHEPLAAFDPLHHLPSGRHLSFFGSAFVFGTTEFPLSDIPFQRLLDEIERGELRLPTPTLFGMDEIQDVHRRLDLQTAGTKMVVMT